MARIELRYCDIILRDGLSGTAAVNQSMTAPMTGDVSLTIDTVVLNANVTDRVPIGARFTIDGESVATIHTVTSRTGGSSTTTAIHFSPPLGAGTYADDGVITVLPQRLTIKIGDGDLTYTEHSNYHYDLDRGQLDTVRTADDAPMDVALNFVYEHITSGTNEVIAPMDAIKRRNGASDWLNAADDLCEPYAIDLLVVHTPPCGTAEKEFTLFPDFRSEQRDVSFKDSNIKVTGKCNIIEPITWRGDVLDEPA